jgi:hypothetical protein
LLPFVPEEDESLSTDDQARKDPLTAMKELGRPSTAIRPPPEQKATKKELIVIPPQKRPS